MMAIDDMTLDKTPFAAKLCQALKHQIASDLMALEALPADTTDGE